MILESLSEARGSKPGVISRPMARLTAGREVTPNKREEPRQSRVVPIRSKLVGEDLTDERKQYGEG